MAQAAKAPVERRKVERTALRLSAMLRDTKRGRVKARVIDMSTNGCRVECTAPVDDDTWVWLQIAGLENQFCRVAWHCQEFVGLEFEKPLAEAVFNKLLADQSVLPDNAIKDLRSIATRAHWLARSADDEQIAILADLSRKCAVDAVVEGLRIGQGSKNR